MKKKPKTIAKILTKNVLLSTLDEIRANLPLEPYMIGSLFACKVAVASFFDLFPDEGNAFWNELREQVPKLNQELIGSQEFQQSLALTFEALLRTREEKKRLLIRAIYLEGYIPADDRQKVYLERFYRICQEISLEALEYLKFINDTILPRKKRWAEAEVAKMQGNHEGSIEWWVEMTIRRKPDSEIIMEWIHEEFSPYSEVVKKHNPGLANDEILRKKQVEKEQKKQEQYAEIASELVALGIFRTIVSSEGFIAEPRHNQNLTNFGHQFIRFVSSLN